MISVQTPLTLFLSYLWLSWPFLLVGILLSSALMVFTDQTRWVARFPRNRLLGSLVGSSLGLLLPVGQLGCFPIVRRFLLQGAPLPLTISFWLAAPTINLLSIFLMFQTLGTQPSLIFLRLALTWLMAIILALAFSAYREPSFPVVAEVPTLPKIPLVRYGSFVTPSSTADPLQRSGNLVYESSFHPVHQWNGTQKLRLFVDNTCQEIVEWGSILVLMTVIAAGIQSYFPEAEAIAWATNPSRQTLLMMLWAVLYPLGALFNSAFLMPLLDQFWTGALLAFLLLGSVLNLQTLGLAAIAFRWRPLLYLGIIVVQLSVLFAVVINFYLV